MSILDWVSFTLPIQHTDSKPSEHAFQQRVINVTAKLNDIMPTVMSYSVDDLNVATPQRPYRRAWSCPNTGWRINADPQRSEALIVFNGGACETLRKMGAEAIREVLYQVIETGTRLDIATDIPTMVTIKDIERAGWSPRIKTTSYLASMSGDTLYVGSRKSGAFARVYRYAEPHPRAGLVRVEHELKKDQARAVAHIAAVHGLDIAQRSVAAKFAYEHPILQKAFSGSSRPVVTERHERTLARTEIWLMSQAAPAFQRLVAEGVIDDPRAWVERYMLGGTKKD